MVPLGEGLIVLFVRSEGVVDTEVAQRSRRDHHRSPHSVPLFRVKEVVWIRVARPQAQVEGITAGGV